MENKLKLKKCPKCSSFSNIKVVLGENKKTLWECSCGWEGNNPVEETLTEEEYLNIVEKLN